jgi:ABC-type thiamine transport system ATPase subunit
MKTYPIDAWDKSVRKLLLSAESAKARCTEARDRLTQSEELLAAVEEARRIVQTVAQELQEQAHSAIAAVVSRCLSAVFEHPYTFRIDFVQRRGRTEADLIFERDGHVVDPKTASGGGVRDLAAFAIRLSCLMLRRPAARPVVFMDEPFKSPSPHYRERVKMLMETLTAELGFQFVFVTNIMELVSGNVLDLERLPGTHEKPNPTGLAVRHRLRAKGD